MSVFVLWLGSGTETTGLALGKHFVLAENSCVAVLLCWKYPVASLLQMLKRRLELSSLAWPPSCMWLLYHHADMEVHIYGSHDPIPLLLLVTQMQERAANVPCGWMVKLQNIHVDPTLRTHLSWKKDFRTWEVVPSEEHVNAALDYSCGVWRKLAI